MAFGSRLFKLSILTIFFGFVSFQSLLASDTKEEGKFVPSEMINHHIQDSHSWEIFHGLSVHLPVILYSEDKGFDVCLFIGKKH
jgi:hypothetical protein